MDTERDRAESIRLVLLPGDGIGPEVVGQARRVLEAVAARLEIRLTCREYPCGGKYFLETGREWPAEAWEDCKSWADAVLLGAVGHRGALLPNGDLAGANVIFGLRFGLDLFANVRPVRALPGMRLRVRDRFESVWRPEEVDMVLVRENTEGAYTPVHGRLSRAGVSEVAVDSRIITTKGAQRVIRFAFEMARTRERARTDGLRRVTCVDKSNVLEGCRLFREVFEEEAQAHGDVEADVAYIDAFCARLMQDPASVDVAVFPNMFGDIATDLAAVLAGGLGMAPSANVGHTHGMFEAVHGSAPDLVGTGKANPMAEILSAAMLLEWIGTRRKVPSLAEGAQWIRKAVADVFRRGEVLSPDVGGTASCADVGAAVVAALDGV